MSKKMILQTLFRLILFLIGVTYIYTNKPSMSLMNTSSKLYFDDYSKIMDLFEHEDSTNEEILVINTVDARREAILVGLNKIKLSNPKIIIVSDLINNIKPSDIIDTLKGFEKVVFASLLYEDSVYYIMDKLHHGFINNIEEDKNAKNIIRTFSKKHLIKSSNKEEYHIVTRAISLLDSNMFLNLINRKSNLEYINYFGSKKKFQSIHIAKAIELAKKEDFENKIVILGAITDENTIEGKYCSPLNNDNILIPDMDGVIVLSNILSMVLSETYINVVSAPIVYILFLVLILINSFISVLILKSDKLKIWFFEFFIVLISLELLLLSQINMTLLLNFRLFIEYDEILPLSLVISGYFIKYIVAPIFITLAGQKINK